MNMVTQPERSPISDEHRRSSFVADARESNTVPTRSSASLVPDFLTDGNPLSLRSLQKMFIRPFSPIEDALATTAGRQTCGAPQSLTILA